MLRRISFQTVVLTIPLCLFACAGSSPPSASSEPEPTYSGVAIHEPKVEEQAVPPVEIYGPGVPDGAPTSSEAATATDSGTTTEVAPVPPKVDGAKLCLVLGPGMAKAMAEASVLEAIRKAKLPVHCVVGTEMGAVVAALYSFANGSTNTLQWQLFKINKDNYFNFPMISLRDPRSSGRRLNEFLRGVFKNKQIEDLPIPFATAAIEEERDGTVEFLRGDLVDSLSASLAIPGIFEPWPVNKVPYRSAAVSEPVPIELAKRLGGNFIVVVDVLTDGGAPTKSRFHRAFTASRSLIRLQKKEASFVIQVNTADIPFDDFSRQGEILAAGASAAEKALPELKAAWEKFVAGSH